jgi:hypothetical protein
MGTLAMGNGHWALLQWGLLQWALLQWAMGNFLFITHADAPFPMPKFPKRYQSLLDKILTIA